MVSLAGLLAEQGVTDVLICGGTRRWCSASTRQRQEFAIMRLGPGTYMNRQSDRLLKKGDLVSSGATCRPSPKHEEGTFFHVAANEAGTLCGDSCVERCGGCGGIHSSQLPDAPSRTTLRAHITEELITDGTQYRYTLMLVCRTAGIHLVGAGQLHRGDIEAAEADNGSRWSDHR